MKRLGKNAPVTLWPKPLRLNTQLDFTIDGAKATFVRNPARGHVTVHETDGPEISIDLKKD